MGTIRQRGEKYQARVQLRGISKSKTFLTHKEAIAWLKKTEGQIELGLKIGYDSNSTLNDIIDRYIREVSIKKKGYTKERIRLLRFQTYDICNLKCLYLEQSDFINWRDTRLKKVKSSTVLREWSLFSDVLTHGVEWGMISENFLTKIKKPKSVTPRDRRYSDNEVQTIHFLSEFRFGIEPIGNIQKCGGAFLFAIETACRAGEIAKLEWSDVDLERQVALLRDTKNGTSRFVPLSTVAIKILETMQLIQGCDERVFKITSEGITQSFMRLKKMAGLSQSNLTFHDTRREAMSRLSKKIPDPMLLAKISGHKDLKILLNTYYAPDVDDLVKMLD